MTRKQLEAAVWRHTHRDYRGRLDDGTRTIMVSRPGLGTCLIALADLTNDELWARLPASVRTPQLEGED